MQPKQCEGGAFPTVAFLKPVRSSTISVKHEGALGESLIDDREISSILCVRVIVRLLAFVDI